MEEQNKKTEEVKPDNTAPAWIAPILCAIGSLGGSYVLWIKPLQELVKAMSDQIEELKVEVKELKRQQKNKSEEDLEGFEKDNDELLPRHRRKYLKTHSPKGNRLFLR